MLTLANNEDLTLSTLAYPDEKSISPAYDKRTQLRETAQEKIFPGGEEF